MVYKSVYLDTLKTIVFGVELQTSITKMNQAVLDRVSLKKLVVLWLITVVLFGAICYSLLLTENSPKSNNGSQAETYGLADGLYLSVASALTLGYGNIAPVGLARLACVIEAIISIALIGLMLGKLISQKQEELMREISSEEASGIALAGMRIYTNELAMLEPTKKDLERFKFMLSSYKEDLITICDSEQRESLFSELTIRNINYSFSKTIETTGKFNRWKKELTTTAECSMIVKEIYKKYSSIHDRNTKVGEKLEDLDKTLSALQES